MKDFNYKYRNIRHGIEKAVDHKRGQIRAHDYRIKKFENDMYSVAFDFWFDDSTVADTKYYFAKYDAEFKTLIFYGTFKEEEFNAE